MPLQVLCLIHDFAVLAVKHPIYCQWCWVGMCADSIMYQYFVKIVPTAYVKIDGQVSILMSGIIDMS